MSKQTGAASSGDHDPTLEALSCLVDGELEAASCPALLQQLCSDPAARRQWTLMHVTGDALRSTEVASLHSEGFAARFASALEAEPAIVAPRAGRGRFVRRVALPGVAVAAAATVLVFVAVPQLRDPAGPATVASLPPAARPAAPVAAPAAAEPASAAAAPRAPVVVVERLPELDAYLAAHREQSGTAVMLRSAPYLRTSATVPR
jgi:sigma-E factor negative regulatory protein RseA